MRHGRGDVPVVDGAMLASVASASTCVGSIANARSTAARAFGIISSPARDAVEGQQPIRIAEQRVRFGEVGIERDGALETRATRPGSRGRAGSGACGP